MSKRSILLACLVAMLALPSQAVLAKRTSDGSSTVPASVRAATDARTAYTVVAQQGIDTTIDVGRIAANSGGGGMLGALIIMGQDDRRDRMENTLSKDAEATVRPLRQVLEGFDVASLAKQATQSGLQGIDWLKVGNYVLIGIDPVSPGDPPSGSVIVDYRYELSHDFSHIRVIADIGITQPQPAQSKKKPAGAYRQSIVSIVQLEKRSYDHVANVAAWKTDEGKAIKAALIQGFERIGKLLPYVLNLDSAQFKTLTDKKREQAFFAGFNGPLISRADDGSDGVLLWSDAFLHGETVR